MYKLHAKFLISTKVGNHIQQPAIQSIENGRNLGLNKPNFYETLQA